MNVSRATLLTLVALLGGAMAVPAATLRVPAEYATINGALDAASPGDTVLVAPGTYSDFETRNVVGPASACAFLKAGVVLKSESGSASTTLDRGGLETPADDFTIIGLFADGAVVEGFRITGNPPEAPAVLVLGLPPVPPLATFRDCVFDGLTSTGTSALAASIASVAMYDCRVQDCQGVDYGTLDIREGHMTAENCLFENCSPTALRCEGDSFVVETLTVRNSIFRNNSSPLSGGAIIANEYDGGVVIEGCLFEGNDSFLSGGAIKALATGPFTLSDNVFVNNRVEGDAFARGGGMYLTNTIGIHPMIEANTFFGCHQGYTDGGAAIYGGSGSIVRNNAFANSTGAPAVLTWTLPIEETCNLFWNNAAGDVVGFTPDSTDVFADPQFCNPDAGDFTVSSTSPCAPGNSPPCEQIGALGVGCGLISIEPTSWGRIKARFRSAKE